MREGSVGLLILLGVGIFGGALLWLSGTRFGVRSYQFTAEFDNANGMKVGSPVVYRGVNVGRITRVVPGTAGVIVTLEVSPTDIKISRNAVIEVVQSGLIGETSVAINPPKNEAANLEAQNPIGADCDSQVIICNGDRVRGQLGVSFNQLLQGTFRIANLYSSPEFFENINSLTKNASDAAAGVARLTQNLASASATVTQDIRNLTSAAAAVTSTADRTASQIGDAAVIAAQSAAVTADQINNTAEQYRLSGAQLNQLLINLNALVAENRGTLNTTLNDLGQTSAELRSTVVELRPVISQFASGQLLQNLETLSNNITAASQSLRDLSGNINSPATIATLRQTLDSARATFENVQKITADLDELTGDPAFRNNLRRLVNGLSGLVSSSDQLQQQIQVAQNLEVLSRQTLAAATPVTPGYQIQPRPVIQP
jgi:phospholipid/cholesterol/gamma-HCH transport system substrate-binding protein